jgi:peptide/nickel transport system substrate-binding protein
VELDQAKRADLYKAFQKIVVDEVPIFFINVTPYHTAYNKGLASLPSGIWGLASPWDELYWENKK